MTEELDSAINRLRGWTKSDAVVPYWSPDVRLVLDALAEAQQAKRRSAFEALRTLDEWLETSEQLTARADAAEAKLARIETELRSGSSWQLGQRIYAILTKGTSA